MPSIPALILALAFTSASVSADELHAIQSAVQKYLDGTTQGIPDLVDEVFLPSLEIQWLGENDTLLRRKGSEYIARIEEGKSLPRHGRIVSIDATAKSAMVKVEIQWNERLYTDYMLLLKVEVKWRIENKIATWTSS